MQEAHAERFHNEGTCSLGHLGAKKSAGVQQLVESDLMKAEGGIKADKDGAALSVDGKREEVSNLDMDDFLPLARRAFRTLHGLPDAGKTTWTPEAQERLFAWVRHHRLLGLFQAGLPEMGQALQSAVYGQAQHTARYMHEAERLFSQLSPVLPTLALVKGPALAMQAWPDPGLRSFDDLDFLCARQDYSRFLEAMQAAGYMPEPHDPKRRSHLWHYGWGITFRHSEGFMVEVNHRFFPRHYPWPCRLDARQGRPFAEQTLDSAAVRAPTPALHLLLCCLHAIWHGWARLAWLADIAGLLARHPGIFLQAQALAARCPFAENALAGGCALAEAFFGPSLCSATAPSVVTDEARALLNGTARAMDSRELRRFHETFMTRTEILSYRLRRIFTPGDGDFRRISLPPALRGLYWLLRPVRGARYRQP